MGNRRTLFWGGAVGVLVLASITGAAFNGGIVGAATGGASGCNGGVEAAPTNLSEWADQLSDGQRAKVQDLLAVAVRDLDALEPGTPRHRIDDVVDKLNEALEDMGAPDEEVEPPVPDDGAGPLEDPCDQGLAQSRAAHDDASRQLAASRVALDRAGPDAARELRVAMESSEHLVRVIDHVVRSAELGSADKEGEEVEEVRIGAAADALNAIPFAALAMTNNLAAFVSSSLPESFQAYEAGELAHAELAGATEALQACATSGVDEVKN